MLQPRRLLSTSSLSRRAAELVSNTSSPVIPQPLDVLLPACSKPCLRAFIADSYPSSSSKSIDTLCTSNTTTGFTLGEAALICENSYCAVEGQVDKGIFSICANVPRAIRPSHDAITVVPMATSNLTPGSNAFSSALPPAIGPPTTTSVDTTKIATATGAPSTTPAPFSPLPPFPTSSSISSFRETASASPSTSTSTSTASVSSSTTTQPAESDAARTSGLSPTVAPTTSSAQGSLNTGQIVGICLAAVAIFGFVLGALLFLYRRRREINRKRRGSRWSDSIEKQPPSPFSPADHHIEAGVSNPRAATPDHSQRFYAPPTKTQEKRRSFWRRSIKPEDIGVAVSPEVVQAGSPTSISSQRTTSQLLPEFPHYSLWPAPLRKSQQNAATFEQRRQPERPTVTFPSTFVERKKTNKPPRIVSSRTGNGLPTDPRAQMYRLGQAKSVNDKIPLTPVYDNGNVSMASGAILPPRQNNFLQPGHPSQAQRKYDPYLQDQKVAPNPIPAQTIKLLPPSPPPAQSEASSSHRAPPLRRGSSASDATNIEDDEDTTPEQETDKQLRPTPLSPVLESPRHYSLSPIERLTSPLNDLAYPSPPRPAAISKQAEKQPRPRVVEFADTLGRTSSPSRTFAEVASRRDHLMLDERSLLSTASSSASSPLRKRDESPSTLLTKRKGDRAADQMLQHGLRLSSSAANALPRSRYQVNNQNETRARKGSDTENDNGINTVLKTPPPKGGQGLKSPPFWTPKLTPTRRGEDLFLRVE